jgi:hypothetical protein
VKATPLAEALGYALTANSLALVATAGSGHRKRLRVSFFDRRAVPTYIAVPVHAVW